MSTNERPAIDLEALLRAFADDLRDVAGSAAPNRGLSRLRLVAEQLRGTQASALASVNEAYRERAGMMGAVLAERRKRLEAYAERQRTEVPANPDRFIVAGRITDEVSGLGLPNVRVRATDLDRREHDLLAEVRTDALGYYRIEYSADQIAERDQDPETYIEVLDDDGKVLYRSTRSFIEKAGKSAFIAAEVDGEALPVNLSMARKVGATLTKRSAEMARRGRVLESTPAAPEPGSTTTPPRFERPVITDVQGIGKSFAERLASQGVEDVASLAGLEPVRLAEMLKISESRAEGILKDAKRLA